MSAHHWSPEWQRTRRRIKNRDSWRCRRCGSPGQLEVHHVEPVAVGGTDDDDNLLTLCRACHLSEHDAATDSVRAWRALVDELL